MTETVGSRPLAWDTEFFGMRCHRIELNAPVGREELLRTLENAGGAKFICIVNRGCDIGNARLISELTSAYIADVSLTFVKQTPATAVYPETPATDRYPPSPAISALAEKVFRDSRFVRDSRLAALGGGKVHGEWVRNAFDMPGKFFITAMEDGRPAGFVLFSSDNGALRIELIGVDDDFRNKGIGRRLWTRVEGEARLRGRESIRAGTQLSNTDAVNFYIRRGCAISDTALVYHLWR